MLNLGTCSKTSNQHRLYYDKRLVLSAKITRCYQLNWLIISSSSWADSAFAVLNSASNFWVGSGFVVEDHWTYEMLREWVDDLCTKLYIQNCQLDIPQRFWERSRDRQRRVHPPESLYVWLHSHPNSCDNWQISNIIVNMTFWPLPILIDAGCQ